MRAPTQTRLPDFVVIGAMKAGTTSLFHYLRAHPSVYMSPLKEVDFFVEEANWRRGLGWYERQFKDAGPETAAVGEASTSYTKFPRFRGVPERIATHLPQARLIYLVRHPIERIRSHYQHRWAVGVEREPFERAVFSNTIYLDISRYGMQVEQYIKYFRPARMLIVPSESLKSDRHETMRLVYSFIGVDPDFVPEVLENEYYKTEGRARYSPGAWSVRRTLKRYVPASKRAKELVDSVLPRYLGKVLPLRSEESSPKVPDLTGEIWGRLADLLRDDVQRLRAWMPESFDGWGIG